MNHSHPVDELMNDHRLIEKVLDALDARLAAGNPDAFPADFVETALDFIVNFADGYHHYREEEALFPAMVERGIPAESGPIGMMLFEHTIGRKCVAGMREELPGARAGDAGAQARLRGYATQYTELLRKHIWKEDNILFKMARQVLDAGAAAKLAEQFFNEQNPRVNSAVRERYAAFANAL